MTIPVIEYSDASSKCQGIKRSELPGGRYMEVKCVKLASRSTSVILFHPPIWERATAIPEIPRVRDVKGNSVPPVRNMNICKVSVYITAARPPPIVYIPVITMITGTEV